MEQIILCELFAKHEINNFGILQVCQFITKENTLYEFLYDTTSKKAVLIVILKVGTPDFTRTSFQFENKDITMAEAFDMYGLKNFSIELDNVYDNESAIWSAPVYLGTPVNSLPLAQGKLTITAF